MKVIIDARESGTSTGRYVDKLIQYLYEIEVPYEFVIITRGHRLDFFKQIAPTFETVATTFKEFSFGEQLGFRKQLKALRADLVHFAMVQQPIFYRGKVVTTMHDLTTARFRNPSKKWLIFTIKQMVYKLVIWYVPRRSQKVIVGSEYVRQDIMSFVHLPEDKFVLTYESADPITDKPISIKELVNQPFLFYVGRPQPHKNLDRLVDAFAEVKQKNPQLKLVLAGKKDKLFEALEDSVRKKGIKDVVFPGFISEGQLRWLYENCRAYVFPSLSEGFGLPGLEAMLHGAPVVSSNYTCLPEIYGNAAEYFDPTDIGAMSASIQAVITNDKLRSELIQKGHLQAQKYSWKKMAEETLELYKEVLG